MTRTKYMDERFQRMLGGKTQKEEKKERKLSLDQWYELQANSAPHQCENCRAPITVQHVHPRENICHILPKSTFKSVMTHPANRWFGCLKDHTNFDEWMQKKDPRFEKMKVIPVVKARVAKLWDALTDKEKGKVPACLVPEGYGG